MATHLVGAAELNVHSEVLFPELLKQRREQGAEHGRRAHFGARVSGVLLRAQGAQLPEIHHELGRSLVRGRVDHGHLGHGDPDGLEGGRHQPSVVLCAVADLLPGELVVDQKGIRVQELDEDLAGPLDGESGAGVERHCTSPPAWMKSANLIKGMK